MKRQYNDVIGTRAADRQRLAVQFINEAREAALIRGIPESEVLIAASDALRAGGGEDYRAYLVCSPALSDVQRAVIQAELLAEGQDVQPMLDNYAALEVWAERWAALGIAVEWYIPLWLRVPAYLGAAYAAFIEQLRQLPLAAPTERLSAACNTVLSPRFLLEYVEWLTRQEHISVEQAAGLAAAIRRALALE
jgi:hypothetical protein